MTYIRTLDVKYGRDSKCFAVVAVPGDLNDVVILPAERAIDSPSILSIIHINVCTSPIVNNPLS